MIEKARTAIRRIGPAVLIVAGAVAAHAQPEFQSRGAPDAPVEMVVYSDFECPFCRSFALAVLPAVLPEFVEPGTLRLRYAHLPLTGIHPNSTKAALAAHCAGRAGEFWSYHDYLFVRQPEWNGEPQPDSVWVQYARNLGIAADEFSECMASDAAAAAVEAQLREGLRAGASGTPTIVINGEAVAGLTSYEQLRRRIRAAARRAGGEGGS